MERNDREEAEATDEELQGVGCFGAFIVLISILICLAVLVMIFYFF